MTDKNEQMSAYVDGEIASRNVRFTGSRCRYEAKMGSLSSHQRYASR